ncbi:sensor histidine kinase [Paenibacillus sp. LPE1-1-1.1]|uniref:sensor histidine kinase n=1 Tax=Paenibacillus sp. LPE1-1-1.1 TaxID=3135230 RepID=UPI00341D1C31
MNYIDLTMEGVYEMSTVLANDPDLQRNFEHAGEQLTPESILNFQKATKQLISVTSNNKVISQASLFHYDSGTLLSTSGYQKEAKKDELEWVQQAIHANGRVTFYFPQENRYDANGMVDPIYSTNNMVVMRLINLLNPQRNKNILLLPLRKDYFTSLIESLLPSSSAQVFLTTESGQVVAGTRNIGGQLPVWQDEDRDIVIRELPGYEQRMLMVKATSKTSGWTLTMIQPEKDVFQQSKQLQLWTYVIIAVSLFIAIWISWFVYSGITKPINQVVQAMRQIRLGKMDTQISHQRMDEFGYVMDSFNHMAKEQRHLIEDVYEKQIMLIKTEMKLLQSQINPHFLYNTLDSIYSEAILNQADDIGEMVMNLSKFFRFSLGKGKEAYTVSETFEHIRYYLNVQQRRFDFSITFHLDERVKHVKLLKLLLQPVVENAILHGLEKNSGHKELTLSAKFDDPYLLVEVKDNGIGIPETRLAYIRQELEKIFATGSDLLIPEGQTPTELFGLRNVKGRLKLHYGDSAELFIKSSSGEGTSVVLLIPLDSSPETDNGREDGSEAT